LPAAESLIKIVASQKWLDALAEPVQQLIRAALDGQPAEVKNALHGVWLGHPLHPALIDLPLGSWSVAFALDVAELIRGRKKNDAAEFAISLGLAGAVAAAIAGLADWSQVDGRAKRIGAAHGAMNLGATALYALALVARKRSRTQGIGVSMLAYAVALSAAYLGGHLVYGEQVGVDHTATADRGEPKKFVAVLPEKDLRSGKPRLVFADGVAVVLVKQEETIYALANTCTHLGGPLAEGKLEGNTIRCPWHGSRFCLEDGRVVESPATFPERVFDVRIRDGQIEIRAAQGTYSSS